MPSGRSTRSARPRPGGRSARPWPTPTPAVRLQAARSSGIRRDREALPALLAAAPRPRRRPSAARPPSPSAGSATRRPARRSTPRWATPTPSPPGRSAGRSGRSRPGTPTRSPAALVDPRRREDALKLADESWVVPAVEALAGVAGGVDRPGLAGPGGRRPWRASTASIPEWSGRWFGTNPLAGAMPEKTEDWDPTGMDAVLVGPGRGPRGRRRRGPPPGDRRPVRGRRRGPRPLLRAGLATRGRPEQPRRAGQGPRAPGRPAGRPGAGQARSATRPGRSRSGSRRSTPWRRSTARRRSNARLGAGLRREGPRRAGRAGPAGARPGPGPAAERPGRVPRPRRPSRSGPRPSAAFPTGRPLPAEVREAVARPARRPRARGPPARRSRPSPRHKLREAVPRLVALAATRPTRAEATRALAAMPDPRAVPVYLAALQRPRPRRPPGRRVGPAGDPRRGRRPTWSRGHGRAGSSGPSALAVERILTRFRPVTDWRVIGPFPRTTAAALRRRGVDRLRPAA